MTTEPIEVETQARQIPTLAVAPVNAETLIAKAIEKGVAVDVMERLLVIRRELKMEAAKEAFDRSMAAFQGECPVIKKSKKVFVKGALRYCYAPLESIIEQVRELLQKHGFSYSVDAEAENGFVTATCKVTHTLGHSEKSKFKVPIDKDAYMGEAQKAASALTFSKRYAFCDAFGIMTGDEDDDANSQHGAVANRGHADTRQTRPRQAQDAANAYSSAPPTSRDIALDALNTSWGLSEDDHIPPGDFDNLPKTPPTTKLGTAPKDASEPALPFPTEKTRNWAIAHLKCGPGQDARPIVTEYLRKAGVLLETENVEHWPLRDVPATQGQMRLLTLALGAFTNGEEAKRAFPSHSEIEQGKPKATEAKPEPVKAAPTAAPAPTNGRSDPAWWKNIIVPIPHKGQTRAEYLKHPETIGQLFEARHGNDEESQAARQRLWGFVHNYEAKPWKGKDGQQRPPSAADVRFREALDAFSQWFSANHPDEKL